MADEKENKDIKQKQDQEVKKPPENTSPEKELIMDKKGKKIKSGKPYLKILIIAIINFIGLLGIITILGLLPDKALELKVVRNLTLSSDQKSKVNTADLQVKSNVEKSAKLVELFPDETGLVEFVQDIEKMKAEGKVVNFSFANNDVVKDKTKLLGIPFVVEFEGTWEQIDLNLRELQSFPFLIRTITVDTKEKEEEESGPTGIINLKYGGFIYVSNKLVKK